MTQQLNNLINELSQLSTVANCYEYYNYVKIDTSCSIEYSHEFLTIYAKPTDDGILVTDLNGILEAADYYKIADDTIKKLAEANGLIFDGDNVFIITNIENLKQAIEQFFNLIKLLKL